MIESPYDKMSTDQIRSEVARLRDLSAKINSQASKAQRALKARTRQECAEKVVADFKTIC